MPLPEVLAARKRFGTARLPFSVFRRKGRRFFYVHFKREGGGYLPAVSMKQVSEVAVTETAFKWLREGEPSKTGPGGGVSVVLGGPL